MRYILAFLAGCGFAVGVLFWLADRGIDSPAYRVEVAERDTRWQWGCG